MIIEPSPSNQREAIYEDIIPMIERGFLTKKVLVNGVQISLRTLNDSDLFLIQERYSPSASNWYLWAIAHSVWLFDGQYLLEDSVSHSYEIYKTLQDMPQPFIYKIYHALLELFSKQNECFVYIESFLYETISRKMWSDVGKGYPNLSHVTGLPGTEKMSLNPIQEVWLSYNQHEDSRVQYMGEWELTKAVMSSQNPKAVQKITDADKKKLSEDKANHQRTHDIAYYRFIGETDKSDFLKGGGVGNVLEVNGEKIFQPKSADELAEEFRRWVTGEEDLHDKVVRNFKEEIKSNADKEFARRHQEMLKAQEEARLAEEEQSYATKLEAVDPSKIKKTSKVHRISAPKTVNPVYDRWFNAGYEPPKEFKSLYEEGSEPSSNVSQDLMGLSERRVILDDND